MAKQKDVSNTYLCASGDHWSNCFSSFRSAAQIVSQQKVEIEESDVNSVLSDTHQCMLLENLKVVSTRFFEKL